MVIATFNETTGWAGKTITRQGETFILEGHGAISATDVMAYDSKGSLSWTSEGTRGLVGSLAQQAKEAWLKDVDTVIVTGGKAMCIGRKGHATVAECLEIIRDVGSWSLPLLKRHLEEANCAQFCALALADLADNGSERALKMLIDGSAQGSINARQYCAAGLGVLASRRGRRDPLVLDIVEPALWRALSNALPGGAEPHWMVRNEAALALDEMCGKRFVKSVLKDEGEAGIARRAGRA